MEGRICGVRYGSARAGYEYWYSSPCHCRWLPACVPAWGFIPQDGLSPRRAATTACHQSGGTGTNNQWFGHGHGGDLGSTDHRWHIVLYELLAATLADLENLLAGRELLQRTILAIGDDGDGWATAHRAVRLAGAAADAARPIRRRHQIITERRLFQLGSDGAVGARFLAHQAYLPLRPCQAFAPIHIGGTQLEEGFDL